MKVFIGNILQYNNNSKKSMHVPKLSTVNNKVHENMTVKTSTRIENLKY